MALPVTEIGVMPLKAGATIEDPSSRDGQAFQYMRTSISQQEGFQHVCWGRRVENESELQFLVGNIDWDSVDSHKKFMASDAYGPTVERILTLVDGAGPAINHACFEPLSPATVASRFSAPVTELVTFYLPSSTSSDDKANFHNSMTDFGKVLQQHAKGFRGTSSGWIVEEVEHPSVGTGFGYAVAVGWDSVEAHMAFRETQEFKDAMGQVGGAIKGATMYHVKFQEA